MLLSSSRNVLLVCLPLLTVIACQGKSNHSSHPVVNPTQMLNSALVNPTANPNVSPIAMVNPNQSAVNQSDIPLAPAAVVNDYSPTTNLNRPEDCETVTLDFETKPDGSRILKGEKITNQYADWGVEIASQKLASNGHWISVPPVIFNTAERPNAFEQSAYYEFDLANGNRKGFDWELTTENNRNALIIGEQNFEFNRRHDEDFAKFPGANADGGTITLYFARPASLISVDMVDVSNDRSTLEYANRVAIEQYERSMIQAIPSRDVGSLQTLTANDHSYTDRLTINFKSAGALDNIKLCIKK
ncbi:MAG: hypothetical protein H7249_07280 [Chitinophagaceae bacterium]|nr:hypothetical protein [Oligoflexus sp.]